MIATGNHGYFNSLRDAPRPRGTILRFCISFRRIQAAFCRAVVGAGPYIVNPPLYNSQPTKKIRRGMRRIFRYLTNCMERVVDQLSPGSRMAAAGFSAQTLLPPSGEGRLCQGSMHTNFGMPGLDQIRQ